MRTGIITVNGEALVDDNGNYYGFDDDLAGLLLPDAKTLFLRADEPEYISLIRQVLPRGWAWRGANLASFIAALSRGFARIHGRIAAFLLHEADPRTASDMLPDWETAFGLPDECASRLDVTLAWPPILDAIGYHVYRNGVMIATVTDTTYTDVDQPPGVSFSYQISTFDEAGNESEKSAVTVFGSGDGELTLGQRRELLVGKITARGGQSVAYLTRLAHSMGYPGVEIVEYREMVCTDPCNWSLYGPPWEFAFKVLAAEQSIHDAVCTDVCTTPLRTWGNLRLECIINRARPAHTIAIFGYGTESEQPPFLLDDGAAFETSGVPVEGGGPEYGSAPPLDGGAI